jgi:hypothetical protein
LPTSDKIKGFRKNMSLFFYGGVETCNDKENISNFLLELSHEFQGQLEFDKLQQEFSFSKLFNLPNAVEANF